MSGGGSAYPQALAVPLDAAIWEGEDGEWLAWRVRSRGNIDYGFARGARPEGCLAAFVALEEAPLAEFAVFVRTWGALGVCGEHGLPGTHAACAPRNGEIAHDLFPRASLTEGWTAPLRIYREPVGVWRELAGRLGAAVRAGRALRAGERGEEADLARLAGELAAGTVGEQRRLLGALVAGWLDEAGMRPVFAWPSTAEAPELTFDAGAGGEGGFAWPARSLYPELLRQLTGELEGASGGLAGAQ